MSTQAPSAHRAAINVLAHRVASAADLNEANSLAPAIAVLAHDDPRPLDIIGGFDTASTGGVTDPSGSPSPVFPLPLPNKTLQCTTTFRTASSSLVASIAAINAELKTTPASSPKRAGLKKQLATLEHDFTILIASYTERLRRALSAV